MHHARHRQIHAMGAALVERVRGAMREEGAGSRTEQISFVIRRLDNRECLGMAGLEDADGSTVIIMRHIASDGCEPCAKACGFAQR